MKQEEKTPAAWSRNCLAMLQEINPSYRKNAAAKGRFIEFIREEESGLYVSHNFVRIRETYYYSFALTFLTRQTAVLHHCMLVGRRFVNQPAGNQYWDDLGVKRGDSNYPSGIWSGGEWRSNTMENLKRGLAVSEANLFPVYRRALTQGKERLTLLLMTADQMMNMVPPDTEEERLPELLPGPFALRERYRRELHGLQGFRFLKGGVCKYTIGPPEPGFNVESIPLEAIVASQLPCFLQERDRMKEMIAISKRL